MALCIYVNIQEIGCLNILWLHHLFYSHHTNTGVNDLIGIEILPYSLSFSITETRNSEV